MTGDKSEKNTKVPGKMSSKNKTSGDCFSLSLFQVLSET
jgi:hypothetical protein